MNVKDILIKATSKLKSAGIENPRLDAEILLAHTLNCRRLNLYTEDNKILSVEQIVRFNSLLTKRLNNIPVAYILQNKQFMSLNFFVTPDVLIPRPDTEILAQLTIENLSGDKFFADLGTGSGALAVSVLKYTKNSRAVAVDISNAALNVAKFNAKKIGVSDRIDFFFGDLFAPLQNQKFNAIISNPPYIPTAEIKSLQAEVQTEPIIALDGGSDGLNFYRQIITAAPNYLTSGGFCAVEIGSTQANAVKNIFTAAGFTEIEILQDLAGLDRVVIAVSH